MLRDKEKLSGKASLHLLRENVDWVRAVEEVFVDLPTGQVREADEARLDRVVVSAGPNAR